MELAKPDICSLPPFSMAVKTNYDNVGEQTQNSVFVQRNIEEFTTEVRTGKNLTNRASGLVTDRVHNQRQTNLCASFAGMTTIRGAAKRFLISKGITLHQISADLEAVQGDFSFTKMLTLLTGCVSPRSLDGLVTNSLNEQKYLKSQFQCILNVTNRLVCKTALESEGWKRILPIPRLFQKYNLIPDEIELEPIYVYHPLSPHYTESSLLTISDALQQNMIIFTTVFCNTMTPGGDLSPHAVTIYKEDQNEFVIKNSYFEAKEIRIDSRVPVYCSFSDNENEFRKNVLKIDPAFSDANFILFDYGCAFKFKDKAP